MRTPAQIAGHPIHPMLVTIPIGLWLFSLVCDLIALTPVGDQPWRTVALYAMVGGCIGAAAAAIPGVVDFLSLKDKPVRNTALAHMLLNVTVLVLFAVNAFLRGQDAIAPNMSLAMSVLAIAMLGVSGWLGGKMVYEAGVGVHTERLNAMQAWGEAPRSGAAAATPRAGSRAFGERAMAAEEREAAARSPRDPDRSERTGRY